MHVVETEIPDVRLVQTDEHIDGRGSFTEAYNHEQFAKLGIDTVFVQDNQSVSSRRGTIRGLHFQRPPFSQDKLVRVVKGAIYDVAVDIRPDSPTFGLHVGVRITAHDGRQLYVPSGFAHGFCTLTPDTEVLYKVSRYYDRDHDAGIVWNDRDLKIVWPVEESAAILSEKDGRLPRLKDIADCLPF